MGAVSRRAGPGFERCEGRGSRGPPPALAGIAREEEEMRGHGRFHVRAWKGALLAAAVAMPVIGSAQPGEQGSASAQEKMEHRHGRLAPGPGGFARMLERNAERLKLEATTIEQIRALDGVARESAKDRVEKQRREREVMRTLLDAESSDESATLSQADLRGQLDTDLRKQDLRTMLAMRRLLTPEQRAELAKLREERHRGRGGKHGRRGPAPGPGAEHAPE
jgi:Spy/CpxP family protein refolding chaperone